MFQPTLAWKKDGNSNPYKISYALHEVLVNSLSLFAQWDGRSVDRLGSQEQPFV